MATHANSHGQHVQVKSQGSAAPTLIQRLCTGCEQEQQRQVTGVQAKLTIGAPNDPYEQEADAVADQVMRMPRLQRLCEGCEEEQARSGNPTLQKKPAQSGTATPVPSSVSTVVNAPVAGSPLNDSVRSRIEPALGQDLSKVRVHSDASAQDASKSLNARAFTNRSNIFLGKGESASDLRLMAHETTHVVQQTGVSKNINPDLLQRTPQQAEALIDQNTSWGNLDETALGREMLRMALAGQLGLPGEVITALSSTDRDDVAYDFMRFASDQQLVRLAANAESRAFLNRLFDEITSGSVAAEEQQQADRILQTTARQTVDVSDFDRTATSNRTKIFPFRLPGLTVFSDAPIVAERERGGVRARSYVRVLGTSEFRAETSTLPDQYFLNGVLLPETEVIGVRLYDQGGIIHYTTPLFLVQLSNATNQRVLETILEAAGIGLTLGSGALAGLGIEASLAARVLLWADRAAFVLGTITTVLREHRSWMIEQFGQGFMDAVDILHSAVAIYGIARVAIEAPRIIRGLRDSYRSFSEAARARSPGLSTSERSAVRQVTQSTDELLEQVDNVQGARSGTRGRAPEQPPASAEPTAGSPRRSTDAPPERAPDSVAAPAAAGSGGGYTPTQAELEGYADQAWRVLGGRGPRPAVAETPLGPTTRGQYVSSPSTIEVGTGAPSAGSAVDTVWHEASHGRIRQLVGFMNEHLGASWQRTLLRPLDEIISYFIGGLGRVIQGPTLSSRLYGILRMLGAPVNALGSMANTTERLLWAAHMVALAAALIWAEVKILLAIRDRREETAP